MNLKKLLVRFVSAFAVSLPVSAIVTLLGNFIVHGASMVDWAASFGYATLVGIIVSWIGTRSSQCGRDCRAVLPGRCDAGQEPVG
jgi:hypothetical protein